MKNHLASVLALLAVSQTADEGPMQTPGERVVDTDTIRMHVREEGAGPLVLMLHGFPELSHSWRYQLEALSAAGYRAVTPDMRGFGRTEAPEAIEAYDVLDLVADVIALMDALDEERAVLVGHDWGAVVAWTAVLLHPERFTGLVTMSVPFGGRGDAPYLTRMRAVHGDNFFYMLYFQEPGVAEAELDPDPRAVFERLFVSPGQEREAPTITDPRASAGGFLGRIGRGVALPPWLDAEDMHHYVETFERTGFRGGLNYYRNLDRNWELTPHLAEAKVEVPVLFLAGQLDLVIGGASKGQLEALMKPVTTDLEVMLYPGAGHWIQQERAQAVNAALLEFLD